MNSEARKGLSDTIRDALEKNTKKKVNIEKDLNELSDEEKEVLKMNFYESLNLAASEWKTVNYIEVKRDEDFQCELCGQKHIEKLYRIENKTTKKQLIVGSSCIDNYKDASGIGKNSLRDVKQMYVANENRKFILSLIPDFFTELNLFKSNQKLKCLVQDYLKNSEREIRKNVEHFEKQIQKSDIVKNKDEIFVLYDSIKKYNVKLQEFINFSDNDMFGINKKIYNYILGESDFEITQQFSKDGKITSNNIHLLNCDEVFRRFIPEFYPLLRKNNIELIKNRKIGKTFLIRVKYRNKEIILSVDSYKFLNKYKAFIFDKNNLTINLRDIVKFSTVNNGKSLFVVARAIQRLINFEFDLKGGYDEINELAFVDRGMKIYAMPYKNFVNKYFREDMLKTLDVQEIIKDIQYNSEKYTLNDYKEHLDIYKIKS